MDRWSVYKRLTVSSLHTDSKCSGDRKQEDNSLHIFSNYIQSEINLLLMRRGFNIITQSAAYQTRVRVMISEGARTCTRALFRDLAEPTAAGSRQGVPPAVTGYQSEPPPVWCRAEGLPPPNKYRNTCY